MTAPPNVGLDTPPPRPSARQERRALKMFLAFSPPLRRKARSAPPAELSPFETFTIQRPNHPALAATWFPALESPRGVVLFMHPWVGWGQTYFHRGGRIEQVRAAGYHAATVELTGIDGRKGPQAFFDVDVADALASLRERAPGLPIHVWGVSAGGYWAHAALARDEGVGGAFFEDVAPHLIEWSYRMAPVWSPFFWLYERLFPDTYRFMNIRRHAPALKARATAYVSGEADRGILPSETRELASLARGQCLIVPGAGHLDSIKRDPKGVIALALDTFARGA